MSYSASMSPFLGSPKQEERRERKMSYSASMMLFCLSLKISSERWKGEKDELLPRLLQSNKKRRFEAAAAGGEEKKKAKKGGGVVGVFLPPPPQRLFLDLNKEPNPMWEEMVNSGKPTLVFNRLLTRSDVTKDLARCILNRHEMIEVLVPALREEERRQVYDKEKKLRVAVVDGQYRKRYEMRMVWWRSLKQFALVQGWTELVRDNGLRKDDLIQLSYFRFGQQQQQLGLLIQCRPEVQVMAQPDQDREKDVQPQLERDQEKDQDQEMV